MCGKETKWNEVTERYERICGDDCTERYKEQFKDRMIGKYGKVHLLDDPDQQKKMLANRKISGIYRWTDKKNTTQFVGSYELDFLKFLDLFLGHNPKDVISPAPQTFYYTDTDGTERFYIADFYIPSISCLVEIKDGGDNPNTHPNRQTIDAGKEKLKDEMMSSQKDYNYVKVINKNYAPFLNFLIDVKNENLNINEIKNPVISISEAMKIFQESTIDRPTRLCDILKLGDTYKWKTFGGSRYEGKVVDFDGNVVYIDCTDGIQRALEG